MQQAIIMAGGVTSRQQEPCSHQPHRRWQDRRHQGERLHDCPAWGHHHGREADFLTNDGPTRVLHLCAGNLYGGVERIVSECASDRRLCPEMSPGFAVCFDGRLSEEIDASGAECTRLGPTSLSRPWTVLRARRRLAALLDRLDRRSAVVVCHSSWIHALAAPVVRQSTSRLVLWLHDRVTGGELAGAMGGPDAARFGHREQQIHRRDRDRALSRGCAFRALRAGSRRGLGWRPRAGACGTWGR